jgi:hypothetical protein
MELLAPLISCLLFTGLVYVLGRLTGGGFKSTKTDTVLWNSRRDRGISLLSVFLVPLICFGYLSTSDDRVLGDYKWVMYVAIAGFCSFVFLISLDTLGHSVTLNSEGIRRRGLFVKGPRFMKWVEVARVFRLDEAKLIVENGQRQQMVIESGLCGQHVFIEECRARLSPEVYGSTFG